MDLDDLKIFRAVVREGGITKAAVKLYRVQSNVTTRIRQLEENLSVKLFLREGRRMVLSASGWVLLGYAERLLDLAEEAVNALSDMEPKGRLRIGSMESTTAVRLPAILADFHQQYPEVAVDLLSGRTKDLMRELVAGNLDCILISGPINNDKYHSISAFKEELVIITHANHPPITLARDLGNLTLLTFGPGCAYRQRLETWLSAGGVAPRQIVEFSSYHSIIGCIASGMGIAIVPVSLLEKMSVGNTVAIHRLQADMAQSTTVLVSHKGRPNPALTALTQLLEEGYQKCLPLPANTGPPN